MVMSGRVPRQTCPSTLPQLHPPWCCDLGFLARPCDLGFLARPSMAGGCAETRAASLPKRAALRRNPGKRLFRGCTYRVPKVWMQRRKSFFSKPRVNQQAMVNFFFSAERLISSTAPKPSGFLDRFHFESFWFFLSHRLHPSRPASSIEFILNPFGFFPPDRTRRLTMLAPRRQRGGRGTAGWCRFSKRIL